MTKKVSKRQYSVAETIKRCVSVYLYNDSIKELGIRPDLVINRVFASADLKNVKFYVCIAENNISLIEQIVDILNKNKAFFKKVISNEIRLKFMPEIQFYVDDVMLLENEVKLAKNFKSSITEDIL